MEAFKNYRAAELAEGIYDPKPDPHPSNHTYSSPCAVTGEHNVHVMIAKGPAVKGLEEVAFAPAAEVVQVGSEGSEDYFATQT